MSLDRLDDWIENNPNDREVCEEHQQYKPCKECWFEWWDVEADRRHDEREERHGA